MICVMAAEVGQLVVEVKGEEEECRRKGLCLRRFITMSQLRKLAPIWHSKVRSSLIHTCVSSHSVPIKRNDLHSREMCRSLTDVNRPMIPVGLANFHD